VIAHTGLNFKKLAIGKMTYLNLYGAPIYAGSALSSAFSSKREQMNSDPELGSAYRGRVLVSASVHAEAEAPSRRIRAFSKPVQQSTDPRGVSKPRTATFRLRAHIISWRDRRREMVDIQ
jgi:hypothetical protein